MPITPVTSSSSTVAYQSQIYQQLGQQEGSAFIQGVQQMSGRLGLNPNAVIGTMAIETGGTFSSSIRNSQSGATGLIQFTGVTAAGLGTSTADLATLTPSQQLPYVEQYYSNQIKSVGQPASFGDTYALVFAPAAVGKSDNTGIYFNGTKAYAQNAALDTNGDGVITAGEIRAFATNKTIASQQTAVNSGSFAVKPNGEMQNGEPVQLPISNDAPIPYDTNYQSPNSYPTNSKDFRVGSGFSNLQPVGNGMNGKGSTTLYQGAPSVFNEYALFRFYGINNVNDLYDRAGSSSRTYDSGMQQGSGRYISSQWKNPTAAVLIDQSNKKGYQQFPYYWTDFLYAKYYGIIPNNRLVTLRRYPLPTYDHGLISSASANSTKTGTNYTVGTRTDAFQLPVAQAVTYFGDDTNNKIDEIMKFTTGMNWKKQTSDVNSVRPQVQGSDTSTGVGKFGALLGVLTGKANGDTISGQANQLSQYDPYDEQNGPLKYKIYGPVNVINETYTRNRGLTYDQTFKIDFVYSLRSIGEINPKMAMLDILANMLSVTYNNAKFWGGANRFFPNTPQYPFLGSQSLWYRRDAGNYAASIFSEMGKAMSGITDFFSLLTGGGGLSALVDVLSKGSNLGMAALQQGHRPDILSIPGLLTGQPVGEWHLVIGNPLNPTLMIGNLICKNMDVSFNNVMGADDFPTEMTCTVTLDHGRPRDKGDIESMFNQGQGRLYYAYQNTMEPWNNSSATRNSTNSYGGGVSTTGLAGDAQTYKGANAKNNGTTDIYQSVQNAVKQGTNLSNQLMGKKAYSTDPLDQKAYTNAVSDGGGSN